LPALPPSEEPFVALDTIRIRGARTHNLKDFDLDLPRDRLIVITGLSGSGKSRWPSTPSMPKDSAVMSNHCRRTPGSSSR
jgi:Excinuclease ABC subunit A